MRDENFNTAEMLKRLQRQVSRLQGGSRTESVTIYQSTTDTTVTTDAVSVTVDNDPGWTWGVSSWSESQW